MFLTADGDVRALLVLLGFALLAAALFWVASVSGAGQRVMLSGWARLAERYTYSGLSRGGRVDWWTPVWGAWLNTVPVQIDCHETGLYLRPVGPARRFAPPVLIPWDQIRLPAENEFAHASREIEIRAGADWLSYVIPRKEIDCVRAYAGRG